MNVNFLRNQGVSINNQSNKQNPTTQKPDVAFKGVDINMPEFDATVNAALKKMKDEYKKINEKEEKAEKHADEAKPGSRKREAKEKELEKIREKKAEVSQKKIKLQRRIKLMTESLASLVIPLQEKSKNFKLGIMAGNNDDGEKALVFSFYPKRVKPESMYEPIDEEKSVHRSITLDKDINREKIKELITNGVEELNSIVDKINEGISDSSIDKKYIKPGDVDFSDLSNKLTLKFNTANIDKAREKFKSERNRLPNPRLENDIDEKNWKIVKAQNNIKEIEANDELSEQKKSEKIQKENDKISKLEKQKAAIEKEMQEIMSPPKEESKESKKPIKDKFIEAIKPKPKTKKHSK